MGYQQNRQGIENEHEDEKYFSPASRTVELFPRQHAPKCRHHGSRLPDGIRNCYPGEAGRDQIEDHAQSPDESAEQAMNVPGRRPAEVSAETDRLADQRM